MSELKKQLFEQLAIVAQSLASPQRMELLDYLAQVERSVEEMSQLSGLSIANTSRHLQILKQNGLVSVRKQGQSRIYSLAGDDVVLLISNLRKTAEIHVAEVGRLTAALTTESNLRQTISSKELFKQINDKKLMVLDIRPEKEFQKGHIEGAVNILPDEIEQQTTKMPIDKKVVTYCRGPYCAYSHKMQDALQSRGISVLRLEEGFPEWKAAGFPFESIGNR